MAADLQAFFSRKGEILIQSRSCSDQLKTAKIHPLESHEPLGTRITQKAPALPQLRREGRGFLCLASHFKIMQETL